MPKPEETGTGTDIADNRFVCIHGHFYQPPRENPWLESIEVQDSAVPYHDWNERICAECYAPNSHARIQNTTGIVERMINTYEWISYNIGPTLLIWLEQNAPEVLEAILEADRKSTERCQGHGNAIAQAYNHTILPLASKRDKHIQVRWGINTFRRYFRREPEGMWLPETAVDTETLEALVDHGIRFTVLSPRQARRFRSSDGNPWLDAKAGKMDTHRPYRCLLPSGHEIILFFYDGEVAQEVAFQRLLNSGERFLERILSRFDPKDEGPQMVHIATDGETFGHHHRFGEMALAYFVSSLKTDENIRITNYGEFLSSHPPTREVEIVEKSSWSCVHGVERWRSACGCRLGGNDFHQRWRAPLREALDALKEKLDALFTDEGAAFFSDPWEAFDAYSRVIQDRSMEAVQAFVREAACRELEENHITRALMLLEMQRHGQLMFTSCAWFFDEVSGIESVQVLKFAARAIQLAEKNFSVSLEEDFLKLLERVPSNDPDIGNGRRLWEKEVRPSVIDLERVLAHFAVSSIFLKDLPSHEGHAYSKEDLDVEILETGPVHFAVGAAEILSHITLQRVREFYSVIHFGGLDVQFFWRPYTGEEEYRHLKEDLTAAFQHGSLGDLYQSLLKVFQEPTHQLKDLFLDEQRRIIEMFLKERVDVYRNQFDRFFDQDSALLKQLGFLKYPIPEPMKMAAIVATEDRIRKLVTQIRDEEDLQSISLLLDQAKPWGYRPETGRWERFFLLVLEKKVKSLGTTTKIPAILQQAEYILEAAGILRVPLNLWNIQNLFVAVCTEREKDFQEHGEQVRSFALRILLSPQVLPRSLV